MAYRPHICYMVHKDRDQSSPCVLEPELRILMVHVVCGASKGAEREQSRILIKKPMVLI